MALEKPKTQYFTDNIAENLQLIKNLVGEFADLVYREIDVGGAKAVVCFFDGMSNKEMISHFMVKPLVDNPKFGKMSAKTIAAELLYIADAKFVDNSRDFMDTIYSGDVGLLFAGKTAMVTDLKGFATRGISEPQTEIVVRGSREGFVENMKTNMSMIRRRVKTENLCFENMQIGTETSTNLVVAYIDGLAKPELVAEVKQRLKNIKIDGILESGYIEQLTEDNPFSPFSTVANSEKPDKVVAKMLEGRVAIIVDGTPMVLTVPMLFVENFQSAEDYYSRPYLATFVRLLRFFAFTCAVYGPALYIAITTYHREIIPTNLMLNLWQADSNTPFSAAGAVLIYSILYEIVREAGIRLPRPVGAAISIVGGLVIGDMAVSAGIISAPVVIIVAFTAIAMFVVDAMTDAATLLRFTFIILAAILGVWGIIFGTVMLLLHLVSLSSFGTPYFAPFAPFIPTQIRDTLVRMPLWLLGRRPENLTAGSKWRQTKENKPPR